MTCPTEVPALIVGAGPGGVTIADLFGTCGTHTRVGGRSTVARDVPHAMGCDDEGLRIYREPARTPQMIKQAPSKLEKILDEARIKKR